ncbi:hypothetical protein [Enterococcus mundtii]|uniref:Uncharacterized protein n=1 Tax=Enterococcus mundtii TaxID=53346 RepID=A0A1V2U8R2_ENTMU|nr:hypothetical protein [Enterococcus mundtii]ONN39624.1 hypothetical protein BTN92_16090 [Enterococcus mundtii]
MKDYPELVHEYHFNKQDHFIETSFVKSDDDAKRTIIDDERGQGAYIEYSNGIKLLVLTNMKKGEVSYYSNYPLRETSPGRFSFVIS